MLDLAKLAGKIPGVSQHFQQEASASRQRIEQAHLIMRDILPLQEEMIKKQQQCEPYLIFSSAIPLETLNTAIEIPSSPKSHTVFATDGSQIAPSHHEIAYCYLLNIGRVMLHYEQNLHPLLDSIPEVYYKPEDIYIAKQWGIRTEEWMGYQRTVLEIEALAEMACRWVRPPGPHYSPNLALVDGSLIYWFLDNLCTEARERILMPILSFWEDLKQNKVPLLGYVSASRSMEAINFLRFPQCPYPQPNCLAHCGTSGKKTPCQGIEPLRDVTLWQYLLKPGQRGPLWQSRLKILDLYDEAHRVYFCYLNVGTEIARVEIPAWVAEDKALLEQSLSILLTQVYKGFGYPIALAEAHNQAVIRSADRNRFFNLLEEQLIRVGLKNVGTSYKEASKRRSIA
jgi:NurA domain